MSGFSLLDGTAVDTAIETERALRRWLAERGHECVRIEARPVENDFDMYTVFEIELHPQQGAASATVFVTEGGSIGLVVDNVGRVARMAGMRTNSGMCIAGYQPRPVSTHALLEHLADVARGMDVFLGRALYPLVKARALDTATGKGFPWDECGRNFIWPQRARSVRLHPWR